MKRFQGYRPHPPEEYKATGLTNSGETPDYEGVLFASGKVVLQWKTRYKSITIYESWDDFWHITGHPDYGTEIVWLDH